MTEGHEMTPTKSSDTLVTPWDMKLREYFARNLAFLTAKNDNQEDKKLGINKK